MPIMEISQRKKSDICKQKNPFSNLCLLQIYHLPQAFSSADEAFRIDYITLLHCILYIIRCFLGNDFAVFIKDHLVEVPCQYESEKVAAGKISA